MVPPTLTIPDVDYGGTIGVVDVVFEVPPSDPYEFSEGIRTGFLVDSAGDTILALLEEYMDAGASKRKGVHVDVGGGAHTIELSFDTPVTQRKSDGSFYQWGYTADDTVLNEASATGAEADKQMAVFANALRVASPDSLTPARLTVNEYRPNGILDDYLDVVLESPEVVQESSSPMTADINLTMIETADINQTFDKQQKLG